MVKSAHGVTKEIVKLMTAKKPDVALIGLRFDHLLRALEAAEKALTGGSNA